MNLTGRAPEDDVIALVVNELRSYRRTGREVHLAHAARALEDLRGKLRSDPLLENVAHVGSAQTRP